MDDPSQFWDVKGKELISWFTPYSKVQQGSFEKGDVAWFLNGKLNVSYNCIDRHIDSKGDQNAIIYEGDEPNDIRSITYNEVCLCIFVRYV